jgi:uncharacterized coiled-coil protein SlyX
MRGTIEERVAYLEGVIENLPSRMDRLEQRMDRLEQRMDSLEQRLSARIDALSARMDTHFRWLVILFVTVLFSMVTMIANLMLTLFRR